MSRSILLILLALLLRPSAPVAAQTSADQEIVESQRRLEEIRRQRAQLAEEMTRIRSRVSDLSSELSNVQRQVTTSAAALRELELQLANREEQIALNTAELELTRRQLAERRAVLDRRLRSIYKRGPQSSVQVLLAAESFSDLLNRYKYLFLVARSDRRLMEEVQELERLLVARERTLRGNMLELATAQRDRSDEHGQLADLQNMQRVALSGVRSQEQTTAGRLAQVQRDEAALSSFIAGIDARRRIAESPAPGLRTLPAPAPTLSAARMGMLDWPVQGHILYRFGRVTQPNGTAVRWNGLGIGGAAGAPVRAVAGGSVALAGPFEGYGPTVIISHGGGYYSLYLYLRDVRVRSGDIVTVGQTVGSMGGERTAEGPHIEFQLRVPGGQAVDPLAWLRPA